MMVMGTLRFAKDNWRQEDAVYPLTHYIEEAFDLLDHLWLKLAQPAGFEPVTFSIQGCNRGCMSVSMQVRNTVEGSR
jgi:hypothetical protein